MTSKPPSRKRKQDGARQAPRAKLYTGKKPLVTPPPLLPPTAWTIIGVDCATQDQRIGLARGTLDEKGKLRVDRVTLGTAGESAASNICRWIEHKPHYIVAFDAPLGWPASLGKTLVKHEAGAELPMGPDDLFHRYTDRAVQTELGRSPAAVGADRIARVAHAALRMLAEVRGMLGSPMPLAWQQARDSGAIEVSPAATLGGRHLHRAAYKADTAAGRTARQDILQRLSTEIDIAVTHDLMIEDADQLDALLCVLAGADFARALCVEPDKPALAKKEGFIWFRGTGQRSLPLQAKPSR